MVPFIEELEAQCMIEIAGGGTPWGRQDLRLTHVSPAGHSIVSTGVGTGICVCCVSSLAYPQPQIPSVLCLHSHLPPAHTSLWKEVYKVIQSKGLNRRILSPAGLSIKI